MKLKVVFRSVNPDEGETGYIDLLRRKGILDLNN